MVVALSAAYSLRLVCANPSTQTLKASKALLAHIQKTAQQKSEDPTAAPAKTNLLQEDELEETPIWLTLTTKRHIADKNRLQPGKIALPHSLLSTTGGSGVMGAATVCLITADPQKAYKEIVASADFPEALRAKVTRVIGLEKLKAKFTQYEAQRKLFSEHDVFLADDRIINRLPKVLGKTFYKTMLKRPIPVVLSSRSAPKKGADGKKVKRPDGQTNAATPAQIAREIEKALGSALVSLSPTTNTAVRIGYAGWTAQQIAENVEAVVEVLVEKWVPQKWQNVRSIHIKGPETTALPIWVTDELWVDGKDVVSNEAAAKTAEAATEKKESKKRKMVGAAAEEQDGEATEESKEAPKKKNKKSKVVLEGDDDKLNTQIAARKASLRKQKAAAVKAMDD